MTLTPQKANTASQGCCGQCGGGSRNVELDLRKMEAPEPMERVLDALSTLTIGQSLRVLIDREPRPLYGILERNGFVHETRSLPDYLFEILIRHQS